MDAKDILIGVGIPKNNNNNNNNTNTNNNSNEKKWKTPKEHQRKPDGISREVYLLTGGVPPLMPALDSSVLKKRPPSLDKVTWQWLSFTNSARPDNLQLSHWVRLLNGVPPSGDYPFAKYNKSVDVVKYTDDEYANYLSHPKWTKDETDTLFDLCQRFDLRFVIIADRFPSPRTVEELKDRYYSVSRTLLVARAPSPADVSGHPLVKEPYNAQQETERKRALSMVLSQSKYQERKDAEVLAEAKRIHELRMLSRSAEDPEKPSASDVAAAHTELHYDEISPSAAAAAIAAVDSSTIPASVRMLQVYLRSFALDKMVEAANSTAGPRAIKRVEEALQDLGVNLKPKVPTKAVCAEHLELRKEILTLLNLQKQLQYKAADGSSYHDGAYADTPGTPKRRAGDHDRPFVPDALNFGGDRVGKRDQKRKGPGRPPDAPSSPATKRARKFKTDG